MATLATPADPRLRQRAEGLAAGLPPLLVAADRIAATVTQGVHGRRRTGVGESFWQFRRYHSGDPAQIIDWRQSAKSQKLFVRENEWDAAESVWLWHDASASMRFRSTAAESQKHERAALLLLALASLLIRAGERVGRLGEDRRPGSGRVALNRIAAALQASLVERLSAPSLPPAQVLPRHAQVVLASDFLAPWAEVEASIARLAAQGVHGHLLQVLDPIEVDLPFRGRARFEGVEGEGVLTVGRIEGLRQAYLDRLAALRDSLTGLCRRIGWTCTFHRTDRPPQLALLSLYGALAREIV
ncbi:MAG: DUF58 domain-containing protein [Alphaproteobacteria bacterium]|nr:DUF58 domain-containing protein [Alphaproteobacteria bacterium]